MRSPSRREPRRGAALLVGIIACGALALYSAAPTRLAAQTTVPAARPFRHHRPITMVVDSLTGRATTTLVLARGKYLLWIQRPRVTLAFTRPAAVRGSLAASASDTSVVPDTISVMVRTQAPQYATTNHLVLSGDDSIRVETTADTSRLHARPFTIDHALVFPLATADLLHLLHATRATLRLGTVRVRLKPDQLEALRDFASRMQPTPHVASSAPAGAGG